NAAAIVDEEQDGQHRQPEPQQEGRMDDTDLGDDMVKLVEYDVISVKRDHERKVHSGRIVVTKSMTPESFAIMVTEDVDVPPDERKLLRVSYTVLNRWPR